MPFPATPALTTDCVVFDERGYVLLIRRGNEPFKGSYALPGGFVDVGERVEDTFLITGTALKDTRTAVRLEAELEQALQIE